MQMPENRLHGAWYVIVMMLFMFSSGVKLFFECGLESFDLYFFFVQENIFFPGIDEKGWWLFGKSLGCNGRRALVLCLMTNLMTLAIGVAIG